MAVSKTKDERFLLKIYQIASLREDLTSEIKLDFLAKEMGQHEKAMRNIIRMLMQANFIRWGDNNSVVLTPNGVALAKRLLSES